MSSRGPDRRRQEHPTARFLDRFLNAVTLVLGLWLVASPIVLGYHDRADRIDGPENDVIVGVGVVLLSAARLARPFATPPFSLVIAALGAWQIVAPFALVYAPDGGWPAAKTNDVAVGVALILCAVAAWLIGAWRAEPGGRSAP